MPILEKMATEVISKSKPATRKKEADTKNSKKVKADAIETGATEEPRFAFVLIPKVNPPIWDSLKPHACNADIWLQKMRKHLTKRIIAATQDAESADKVLKNEENVPTCFAQPTSS